MPQDYIKEGTTSYFKLDFYSPDNIPIQPSQLRYKISSSDKIELIPWTTISPNTTQIKISSANNMIGTNGTRRFFTVEATYNNGDDVIYGELEYYLTAIKGI